MGRDNNVRIVPFSVGGVELAPGEMFRVSGSDQPEQFIRITKVEAGSLHWEGLSARGVMTSGRLSFSVFRECFRDAILKFQVVMTDDKWEAFADFLAFISRWQLDRPQVWQMYLWFQDMAIEREMADMAEQRQRKKGGG